MRKLSLVSLVVLGFTVLLGGCSSEDESVNVKTEAKMSRGEVLAQELMIIDSHIDVPWRLKKKMADVGLATSTGQFDYPRAVEGGLNAAFMSIYIPASVDAEGGATALADELIDLVENIVNQHPDKFAIVSSTADVEKQFKAGKVSLALGMENGGPIAGDFANLKHFYDRGIRYITLTHSKSNHISDSSYDDNKRWDGLSAFGETLIPEMNRLGVMVDISHVSDAAFYDVLAITKVPVVATHSSARHFVPAFERNMDDDMLIALAKNGGVMQLNIGSSFLSQKSSDSSKLRKEMGEQFLAEHNLDKESEAGKAAIEEIKIKYPFEYATMEDVLDHVDHVVQLTSINNIGVGTDFDGVGDSLPVGFKDVSDYPGFIDGLLARGYSESDIEKILSGNIMRVWKAVESYAADAG